MKRWRRLPAPASTGAGLVRAVESLSSALTLRPSATTTSLCVTFLSTRRRTPRITGLEQLRRDPHILGWMSRMRAQAPPLTTATCIGRLVALRAILNELAWINQLVELARLIRREDIPRAPQSLPRPLTAEQDQLLQQEFIRRNDLGGNPSCCFGIPACASVNVSTSLMTACVP